MSIDPGRFHERKNVATMKALDLIEAVTQHVRKVQFHEIGNCMEGEHVYNPITTMPECVLCRYVPTQKEYQT